MSETIDIKKSELSRIASGERVAALAELATGIAHEVNQPLTAISTFAQALRASVARGLTDPVELEEVLERIAAEATRAGESILKLQNLLSQPPDTPGSQDLNELLEDVVPYATTHASMFHVPLIVEPGEGLPPVYGSRSKLEQVILNLVRNGVEAAVAAGTADQGVVIRTGRDEEGWSVLSVIDHGPGLTPAARKCLYQPFFTTKPGGVGMGLSYARSAIARLGGRLYFTESATEGTVFSFALPQAGEIPPDEEHG